MADPDGSREPGKARLLAEGTRRGNLSGPRYTRGMPKLPEKAVEAVRRLAKDIADADAQSASALATQPGRTPEDLLAAILRMGDLERALGALPAILAEPLLLYLDEVSDAETAGSPNVATKVVRERRQIARALLRRRLSKKFTPDSPS